LVLYIKLTHKLALWACTRVHTGWLRFSRFPRVKQPYKLNMVSGTTLTGSYKFRRFIMFYHWAGFGLATSSSQFLINSLEQVNMPQTRSGLFGVFSAKRPMDDTPTSLSSAKRIIKRLKKQIQDFEDENFDGQIADLEADHEHEMKKAHELFQTQLKETMKATEAKYMELIDEAEFKIKELQKAADTSKAAEAKAEEGRKAAEIKFLDAEKIADARGVQMLNRIHDLQNQLEAARADAEAAAAAAAEGIPAASYDSDDPEDEGDKLAPIESRFGSMVLVSNEEEQAMRGMLASHRFAYLHARGYGELKEDEDGKYVQLHFSNVQDFKTAILSRGDPNAWIQTHWADGSVTVEPVTNLVLGQEEPLRTTLVLHHGYPQQWVAVFFDKVKNGGFHDPEFTTLRCELVTKFGKSNSEAQKFALHLQELLGWDGSDDDEDDNTD